MFFERDILAHLLIGLLIYFGYIFVMPRQFKLGVWLTLLTGIGWECFQVLAEFGTFDLTDAIVTGAGGLIGYFILRMK